jgi:predicted PurR-regulated permease PerM
MAAEVQYRSGVTQRALRWAIFLGATALVVYLCLRILSPLVNVIAWSTVLAVTFHPVHEYVMRKTGRASVSALVTSALVVVAFVIPFTIVAGLAIDQFLALGNSLQETFGEEGRVDTTTPFGQAYQWLTQRLGVDANAILAWLRQHASELARLAAEYTVTLAASVTGAVVSFVFIIFTMFLLFRDGSGIIAAIPGYLPFERTQSEALLARIGDVVHGTVYGVVVIALIQGALCGGMFWILDIPSAALWGMVTVLTSVLPLVGAAGVWVPDALYLAATGRWPQAIVLAVWGTFVISAVDNFLRPRLVGDRVGLSELVTFFALLGGLRVFGMLGIVLGPLVFAIAASIVDVLRGEAPPGPAPDDRRPSHPAV